MEAHSGMDNTKMVKANYNSLSPNLLFEQLFYHLHTHTILINVCIINNTCNKVNKCKT